MPPITILYVYPLFKEARKKLDDESERSLSSPIVKSYLSTENKLHVLWEDKFSNRNEGSHCVGAGQIENIAVSSCTLKVFEGTAYIGDKCKVNLMPPSSTKMMVYLPSQDPTVLHGIPCLVKAYYSTHDAREITENQLKEDNFTVSNETLIQIMTPIIALEINEKSRTCIVKKQTQGGLLPIRFHSLKNSLCGISPVMCGHNESKKDEQILSCFGLDTQRALLLWMQKMMKCPSLVGTTYCSFNKRSNHIKQSARLHRALDLRKRGGYAKRIQNLAKYNIDMIRNDGFDNNVALTVYDNSHGSYKSDLVVAVARSIMKCHAVHSINGSAIFAKFGAAGSDSALEAIIHQIALSTAIQALANRELGAVCIILDQLDSFVPCRSSKVGRDGDPSTSALYAIGRSKRYQFCLRVL